MRSNSNHRFDAESYVDSVAYSKANMAYQRSGQSRADYVYQTYMRNGMRMWSYLTAKMPWYEAEKWLRLWFGNEDTFDRPITAAKRVGNDGLKPGAECWANYTKSEFESILKKLDDSLHGNKSESNAKRQLKNAVDSASLFVSVKPGIYDEKRHGEWISESEFNSMLESCKEIVAKYEAVSSLQTAA